MEPIFVSRKQFSELAGVSLRTVDHLLRNKEVVSRRVGRRRMIPRAALESFVRRDHPTRPRRQAQEAC